MVELHALHTNVYLRALRDPARLALLKRFLLRSGLRVRVNAVVALELHTGARTPAHERAVSDLLAAYAERDRVIVPSFDAYRQGGRVLATLAVRERMEVVRAGSLVNDILIATSSEEAGVKLVTETVDPFVAIQRHLRGFRFAAADQILL